MADLQRLEELKVMMVETDDFRTPWNYFFDHFGEDRHFMSLGKRAKSRNLTAVIEAIAQRLFGADAATGRPHLIYLRKHKFVHGSCPCNDGLMVLFFFTDIDMGMVSATRDFRGTGGTLLVRFSSHEILTEDGQSVLMNSPGQGRVH